MIIATDRNSRALETFVEAYEEAHRERGVADARPFLPPPDHPLYHEIGVELLRIDLEFSWQAGAPNSLEHYCEQYPQLCGRRENFRHLAFEEYRLRRQSGDPVLPDDYRRRYQLEVDEWPVRTEAPETTDRSGNVEGVADLGDETDRLTSAVQVFPKVGDRLADFDLIRELGRGSFGRVFLARQTDLADRRVALKVSGILPIEPERMAQLQHTNIVPIFSLHRAESLQAICMPYFGDRTLADALREVVRRGTSPRSGGVFAPDSSGAPAEPNQVSILESADGRSLGTGVSAVVRRLSYVDASVWVVARIAEGLAHAHQRGILHRDLKPANILLAADGRPMILDFNLSDDVVVGGRCGLMVGGTLPYMAPEHLRSVLTGQPTGCAADIYSLGVILFELLARRRPFPDRVGAVGEVLRRMIADRQGERPDVRHVNGQVPPSIAAVVKRCLAWEPTERYASAEALAEDLRRHQHDLPLHHVPDRSLAERARKWSRRHPRLSSLTSLAAALAVMSTVALSVWIARGQRLQHLEAAQAMRQFESRLAVTRIQLTGPGIDTLSRREAVDAAYRLLGQYGIPRPGDWDHHPAYRSLDRGQRQRLRGELADLLYLVVQAESAGEAADLSGQPAPRATARKGLRLNQMICRLYGPEVPRAVLQQQADLLQRLGRNDEAKATRRRSERIPSRRAIDGYLLATDHYARGEFNQALPLLLAARDEDPQDVSYWFGLANAYVGVGKPRDAETCFTTCIALQPDAWPAYFHRGLCRLEMGQFQAAREDFDEVLRRKPEFPAAWVNRALAYQGEGKLEAARRDLDLALKVDGAETRLFFLRARIQYALGNHQAARRDRAEGLRRQPRDEVSWVARGIARMKENPQAAMADFQEALQMDPASRTALQNVAHLASDLLSQPRVAISALNRMIELDPRDAAARAGRGVVRARLGDRPAAVADAQAALGIRRDAETFYLAGCTYALTSREHPADMPMATALLGQAFRLDWHWLETAKTDPDLASLRTDGSFQTLVSAAALLYQLTSAADGHRD